MNIYKKTLNILFSTALIFNNIYAVNISNQSDITTIEKQINSETNTDLRAIYDLPINTNAIPSTTSIENEGTTAVYTKRINAKIMEKKVAGVNPLTKSEILHNVQSDINNTLDKEELLYNISGQKSNKIGSAVINMIGKPQSEVLYNATVYNIDNNSNPKISKDTNTNIAKVYAKTKSRVEKQITISVKEKYTDIEDATYKCKNPSLYQLMDKIRISSTKRTYDLNVIHSFKLNKAGEKQIISSRDISNNTYTYVKGQVLLNGNVIGNVDFLNNTKTCVRYMTKNSVIQTCENGFTLNNNGICEKKVISQDYRRKSDYYTCKTPKVSNNKDIILVSNSKVVDFKDKITKSCDNLPKNNDRLFYESFGTPVCINEYEDKINVLKDKYYFLTNKNDITNFKSSACTWNVLNNYKLNMDSRLTDAAIYSTQGDGDVTVLSNDLLENGKEYAFVLISSGEAKLLPNTGISRKATYSDNANSTGVVTYKGRQFATLMNTKKTTVANNYETYTYKDLIENPNYTDIIKNDFDLQKKEIEELLDTTNFDTNRIYQVNALTKRALIYTSGYFQSDGKIYKTGEPYIDENGNRQTTAVGVDSKDTYFKDTTKQVVLDRNNSNFYYFQGNDNIDGNIETQTTFTKIVLQDTFKYNGTTFDLIKKPSSGDWNYKLLIFDVNTMKKTYDYIKSTYYPNNQTVKNSFTFHDRAVLNQNVTSVCSGYNVLYNTCADGSFLVHANVSNKSYEYRQDITQAVCSNSEYGAVLSDNCKVKANLYQTSIGNPQLVPDTNKCLSLFKYDNSNPKIKAILDILNSKTLVINNINDKFLSYDLDSGFTTRIKDLNDDVTMFQVQLADSIKLLDTNLQSNYNINTDEGKAEIEKYKKIFAEQDKLLQDIKDLSIIISDKVVPIKPMPSVTANDAINIVNEIDSKIITEYKELKDAFDNALLDINNVIETLDEEDIYSNEYQGLLDLLYKNSTYVNNDLYLDLTQYNGERDKEKYFVEDIFADYSYQNKNRTLVRNNIYGEELLFNALKETNTMYKTVVYPQTCKLGEQVIDCNDKIINSTNVCELVETEPKTFCSSGYSYIGGGLCAKESCSPGYYFGSTLLNGLKFKGCIKSEVGTKGCESDKNGNSFIKYIMKYNSKNELMCYSLPIFPDIQMGNIAVSAKLKGTFGFDGHTKPTGLSISNLSHQFNEAKNSFDLQKLDGVLTINNREKAYFYWTPGENYLIWNSKSYNIQGMGEYVGHDVSFGNRRQSTANKTPSTSYCSGVPTTQRYSSVCSSYGTKPFGVSSCSKLYNIFTNKVCKDIQTSMANHSMKVQSSGMPAGSDGHHYMYYVTRYAASDLFADLRATSLNMIFTCKTLNNNGTIIMQPKEQPNNTISKTLNNFNIHSIPSSSLPAWCVNVKKLDGCTNNIQEYGDCESNGKYVISSNRSKFCYITRPKLANSCQAVMYEIPVKTDANCNTFNNFHNVGGECKRITYNDAIHNTDYYCTLIPSDFNPFGDKNFSKQEKYKNIANNDKKVLKSGKAMSFDISIESVSISNEIKYNQTDKTLSLKHDLTQSDETAAYNTNYYKIEGINYKSLMQPRVNVHTYNGNTYTYKNKGTTKYRGFLLNKQINYNFNYNKSDEEFYYQKNLFNVHLEDETYEYSNVIGSTSMDNRFGFIKNKFEDLTPFNITKNKTYACTYKYTLIQLPDCNTGIPNADKEVFTLTYDYNENAFVCQAEAFPVCNNGKTYNDYLKMCVQENENLTCPTEYSLNGKTYRKSSGEIKQVRINGTSVICQLKKEACDNKSIEAKCPYGFEYDNTTAGSVTNGCVYKAKQGTVDTDLDLLKEVFNGNTTLTETEICPNIVMDDVIKSFYETIGASPKWSMSKDKKTCSTTEYERITTDKKTLHVKYALTNSISVGENFGKEFNLLSQHTMSDNTMSKTASEFFEEGYRVKGKNVLRLPIFVLPENKNEDVILSVTGLGKPTKIYNYGADKMSFDEIIMINDADIIKGFNDTTTRILNTKLEKKPYLIVYEWNLTANNKNKVLNYFCDNALCAIPDSKPTKFEGKSEKTILELIDSSENSEYVLNDVLYNNCPNNDRPLSGIKNKIDYCYNADVTTASVTKDLITIVSSNINEYTVNSSGTEIRSDVIFGLNKTQNYPCNIAGDWSLVTRLSESNNIPYNICYKSFTSGSDTIELERPINKSGVSYKKVFVSSKTDNKCYGTTIYSTPTVTTNNNLSSSGKPLLSGIKLDANGNLISNPLNNFVMNIESSKFSIGRNSTLNVDFKLKLDNTNRYSYYCIDSDTTFNTASEASVLFYSDLLKGKGTNNKTANDVIKLYDQTNSNLGYKAYTRVSMNKPAVLSKVIVKNKDNRAPVISTNSTNIDILNFINKAPDYYDSVDKNTGIVNYKLLDNLGKDREICFVFDIKKDSDYFDSGSLKPINKLNDITEKSFGMYALTTETCDSYIEPVNWSVITQLDDAPLTTLEASNPSFVKNKLAPSQVELMNKSTLDKLQSENRNLCAVQIRCEEGYNYDAASKTCILQGTYTPTNYKFTEDYLIKTTENGYKTVSIQVEDITKKYDIKTIVKNGVKIDGSFKSTLICDDGTVAKSNVCPILKTMKAVCKKPIYYNGVLLDYKIDETYGLTATRPDAYVCTFIKPKTVQIIKGVMPKLNFSNSYDRRNAKNKD